MYYISAAAASVKLEEAAGEEGRASFNYADTRRVIAALINYVICC
jgi:hypothetical protein